MSFFGRQPPGTPSGGQFAAQTHAEVDIRLDDPSVTPLPILRLQSVHAVRDAIDELESPGIESFRDTYRAFPVAAYASALESLHRMRAEMVGDPPMSMRSGARRAIEDFGTRSGNTNDGRSISEMQADTTDHLDAAVRSLSGPMVTGCREADRSFPSEDYFDAIDSLRAVRDQLGVGVPARLDPDVARAWDVPAISGMVRHDPHAARSAPAIRERFLGPQLGSYSQRLLDAIAERDAAGAADAEAI